MTTLLRLTLLAGLALGLLALPTSASAAPRSAGMPRLTLEEPTLRSPKAGAEARPRLFTQAQELDATRLLEAFLPQDDGGGAHAGGGGGRGDLRPVLGLLLGIFIGFGIGHLVVGDRGGFVLWLVIDLAVLVAAIVLDVFLPWPLGFLPWLGFLVERIIQGVDAYGAGGGGSLVDRSYDGAILAREAVAVAPAPLRFTPVAKALEWNFAGL